MDWSIAFVIVGSVWALVVYHSINTNKEHERADTVRHMQGQISEMKKSIEWLEGVWRAHVLNAKKD